jgi:hypothetical protein
MRRYTFLVLLLLLTLTPIKAEVQGVGSFSSAVNSLQKGLTFMSYSSPLEIKGGRGRGGSGAGIISGITSDIRNPKVKSIVEYLLYGFLFLFLIFFDKDDE